MEIVPSFEVVVTGFAAMRRSIVQLFQPIEWRDRWNILGTLGEFLPAGAVDQLEFVVLIRW